MIILGIDPGTATIGYGALEVENKKPHLLKAGVISTSKDLSDAHRLEKLASKLTKLLEKYKPEVVVVEKIYFSKNVKTAITVAQARGVILLVCRQNKIKIIEASPQDIKLSVAGYGNATKSQVQKMVKMLLSLKEAPKPDDAADAVAAALSVSHRLGNL